jgi:hypothetical protein
MSNISESPYGYPANRPLPDLPAEPSPGAAAVAAGAALLGSVVIGLLAGLIWNAVAPKALYVVVGKGSADVVNPETNAFIVGDAWFCLIAVIGGLIIGMVSYRFAIRKYGPLPMLAVLAGSIIAGCAARWVGQNLGLAKFNAQLLSSHQGALLHAPPVLGSQPSILWPAIAFWPFGACLIPVALIMLGVVRERQPANRGALAS